MRDKIIITLKSPPEFIHPVVRKKIWAELSPL